MLQQVPIFSYMKQPESTQNHVAQIVISANVPESRNFHSSDLGTSWTEITPENASGFMGQILDMVAIPNTGDTPLPHEVVAVDENTFYKS